ncbi:MAG: tRNA (guanosine(37)-N1)-methyltransferase TrmD [Candidatus Paceibacterota bacterium]
MFESYLGDSILARAIKGKKIKVRFYNPRDFVRGKLKKVWPDGNISSKIDDKPYGGGPGMVMIADPVIRAWESAVKKSKDGKVKTIIFAPGGKKLDTNFAKNSAKKYADIIMICGRYEGIDARVKKITKAEEVSIGDYVLTGGEIPAMVLIDTVSRQIEGVLGKIESLEESRIAEQKSTQDQKSMNIKKMVKPKVQSPKSFSLDTTKFMIIKVREIARMKKPACVRASRSGLAGTLC